MKFLCESAFNGGSMTVVAPSAKWAAEAYVRELGRDGEVRNGDIVTVQVRERWDGHINEPVPEATTFRVSAICRTEWDAKAELS